MLLAYVRGVMVQYSLFAACRIRGTRIRGVKKKKEQKGKARQQEGGANVQETTLHAAEKDMPTAAGSQPATAWLHHAQKEIILRTEKEIVPRLPTRQAAEHRQV